jgi:integrase
MPVPWPIARPGAHGHENAGKYLLASAREAAILREPAPVHRAPVCARQCEVPIGALPPGGVTLGQGLNRFLQTGMRRATPATRTARTEHVRWLCHFFGADRPLSEFSGTRGYRLLSEYVAKEGTDPGGRGIKFVSLKKRLGTLRMAFTEAIRIGDLDALPSFPDLPRDSKPRERYLTLDEYRGIVATITPPWDLWVIVAVWTGMHSSDVDSMTWAMVDLGAGPGSGPGPGPAFWWRRNTKNKKQPLWLPMPDEMREALSKAYQEAAPNSPNRLIVGKSHNMRRQLKRACRKLGIPRVAPIDLRRTCATWWIEKGGPKDALRQWLGHSANSEMVDRHYAQVTPAMAFQGVDALNRAARDPGMPTVVMGPRLLGPVLDEGRV